jgi:geranylgeranyl diphosphate synthase type II
VLIFKQLEPLVTDIQGALQRSVKTEFTPSLREPILYFLESPGKKIRPLLTLLSCQAVGGRMEDAMPAAVGIELFHDFTLIHDDIMDKDDLRRGRFTVHKKWGEDSAILVGDLLVGLAYENMLQCQPQHLSRILTLFNETLIKVCEGQALDKEFEKREYVSPQEYIDMISKKTAWLFKLSTQLGAILGGAGEDLVDAMTRFGDSLGIGFQIQDDWLDYTGEESSLGKKVGSDLKLDKKTYVALSYAALLRDHPEMRVRYPLRMSDYRSLPQLKEDLFHLGIAAEVEARINGYMDDALKALKRIQPLDESNRLYQLVLALHKRQS